MAEEITRKAFELIKSHDGAYCNGTGGKIGFHAQSGIDGDLDVTPGVRIRYGEEPVIFDQIRLQATLQGYFDTGVSDIYVFDKTAQNNPQGVLKIIKGAMKKGMKIFVITTSDSELIRITGYLVKRTDVEKYFNGEPLREGTVKLGADSLANGRISQRKIRGQNESMGK